ncbi:MAG: holo-ACP synthase [Clostridia bacterium]|nr:holo-ACP synthase [Clostridia bacterium]
MKGIGIDLCAIERIEKSMNERFLTRYFTQEERDYIAQRGQMGAQSAAAMFAAKEAFLKAVGIGIGRGIELCEVGVVHTDNGVPVYHLCGKAAEKMDELGAKSAFLSLSHEVGIAAAVCVIE